MDNSRKDLQKWQKTNSMKFMIFAKMSHYRMSRLLQQAISFHKQCSTPNSDWIYFNKASRGNVSPRIHKIELKLNKLDTNVRQGFGEIRRKGKYRKKKQENVEKKNAQRESSEIKNIELGKRRKWNFSVLFILTIKKYFN